MNIEQEAGTSPSRFFPPTLTCVNELCCRKEGKASPFPLAYPLILACNRGAFKQGKRFHVRSNKSLSNQHQSHVYFPFPCICFSSRIAFFRFTLNGDSVEICWLETNSIDTIHTRDTTIHDDEQHGIEKRNLNWGVRTLRRMGKNCTTLMFETFRMTCHECCESRD